MNQNLKNLFAWILIAVFIVTPIAVAYADKTYTIKSTYTSIGPTSSKTFTRTTSTSYSESIGMGILSNTIVDNGKVDFNLDGPTQAGWIGLGHPNQWTSARGFGWIKNDGTPTDLAQADRGAGSGGPLDDLEQDIHYTGAERWFKIAVDDGVYDWTLYYGDAGYAHGPFDVYDNEGLVASGLSTLSNEWKTLSHTTTVSGGYLYIKILNPQNNASFNGIEWSGQHVTVTSIVSDTKYETTTITTSTLVTPATSYVTTTLTGGTSTITFGTTTIGPTVSYDVSKIKSFTVSVIKSITEVAAGTITGYETSTSTSCLTNSETETTSETATTTSCFTDTSVESTTTRTSMTALVCSTSTNAITTATIDGTSTETSILDTITESVSTSIVGVVGGGINPLIIVIFIVSILVIGALWVMRR